MTFEELEKKVVEWGADRKLYDEIDGSSPLIQMTKLQEELNELKTAIEINNELNILDGIGDMLVVLTHIATMQGYTLFGCYAAAYLQIKDRKGKMINGIFVKEV